jgi:large subunit ribosomal protein L15
MGLHNFQPSPGSTTRKRRVARGIGSGMGKTATRGTKGQKARRQVHPNFEGGQTPIQRRLPVKKGFRNVNHKEYAVINLDDLERFEEGAVIGPEALLEAGIINKVLDGVKILGWGELTKKVTVQAHRYSASAKEAIEAKGGEAQTL